MSCKKIDVDSVVFILKGHFFPLQFDFLRMSLRIEIQCKQHLSLVQEFLFKKSAQMTGMCLWVSQTQCSTVYMQKTSLISHFVVCYCFFFSCQFPRCSCLCSLSHDRIAGARNSYCDFQLLHGVGIWTALLLLLWLVV